jgi:hypothetical protein
VRDDDAYFVAFRPSAVEAAREPLKSVVGCQQRHKQEDLERRIILYQKMAQKQLPLRSDPLP